MLTKRLGINRRMIIETRSCIFRWYSSCRERLPRLRSLYTDGRRRHVLESFRTTNYTRCWDNPVYYLPNRTCWPANESNTSGWLKQTNQTTDMLGRLKHKQLIMMKNAQILAIVVKQIVPFHFEFSFFLPPFPFFLSLLSIAMLIYRHPQCENYIHCLRSICFLLKLLSHPWW